MKESSSLPVETKEVRGRRELHYSSLEAVVTDAEILVASPHTKILGNWPLERLLMHLSVAVKGSLDGMPFETPWFMRLLAPIVAPFIKRRLLTKMPPGFRLPGSFQADFYPDVASLHEALETFRTAVARTRHERMTARHPILGKLTHEEWTQLHLRHAELHLSFVVPD